MAKRRTRKQKEKAKHQFTISWEPATSADKPEPKKGSIKATVKGQSATTKTRKTYKNIKEEMAKVSAKPDYLALIKRDIIKSIILASLVLSLELVIYLAWSQ